MKSRLMTDSTDFVESPPRVVGMHELYDVWVGRPSPWGNIYNGTGVEVVRFFTEYLLRTPLLMESARRHLQGKVLGCCGRSICHANSLLWIANTPLDLVLDCPRCGEVHLDEDEWINRNHRTHMCRNCQHTWRPKPYWTRGVER